MAVVVVQRPKLGVWNGAERRRACGRGSGSAAPSRKVATRRAEISPGLSRLDHFIAAAAERLRSTACLSNWTWRWSWPEPGRPGGRFRSPAEALGSGRP